MKIYDKFSQVLRIEATSYDISFLKHHRKVEHRDGHSTRELASMKKSIYSIIDLHEIMLGCNQHYLAFLDSLDDTSAFHSEQNAQYDKGQGPSGRDTAF